MDELEDEELLLDDELDDKPSKPLGRGRGSESFPSKVPSIKRKCGVR